MGLDSRQKSQIENIILHALTKKISEYRLVGDCKPFHETLFTERKVREASFFGSCSTTIGVTLFQEIPRLIAEGNANFTRVEKAFRVEGRFSNRAKSVIEDIIFDLGRKKGDSKKRLPNIRQEIREVLAVSGTGGVSSQIADLFLQGTKNRETYIEIKTVKPNKGEAEKAKRTILKIVSLRAKPVSVLVGMAYNPYEPGQFAWPPPLPYFTLGEDLLVGADFWEFLGGRGTYNELLRVFSKVGRELGPRIQEKIRDLTL